MPDTMTLINGYTASGTVENIQFTSIPQTYTDLCLKLSLRSTTVDSNDPYDLKLTLNSTGTITSKVIRGNGSVVSTNSITDRVLRAGAVPSNWTSSTFSNVEIYIPNYTGSQYKSWSVEGVTENNSTNADMGIAAVMTSITAAISSITIAGNTGDLVQYSSAHLYGIKNS